MLSIRSASRLVFDHVVRSLAPGMGNARLLAGQSHDEDGSAGVKHGWGQTLCKEVLEAKKTSNSLYLISSDDTVLEAVKKMTRANVGSLVVYDPAKVRDGDLSSSAAICGIITERDYLTKVAVQGRSSASTSVREVMTLNVRTVRPHSSVLAAMAMMIENNIRHIPVVEDRQLKGMLSMRDVANVLVREHREEVEDLHHYITHSGTA